MEHLNIHKEVKEICDRYNIENWSVDEDGLVNIDGDVYLIFKNLKKLPLNFGSVRGNFSCGGNELTSLEGTPKKVDGYFNCSDNKLNNLEGAPEEVGGSFYCGYNDLTTLEGTPVEVDGDFRCNDNKLTTLEDIPFGIKHLYCSGNPIYEIWKFIDNMEYLQEFVEVYDVVRPGKVVILEYLNDIRKLIDEEPVKREEIPDDWKILDI